MGQIMLNKSFIGSWGQENMDNIPHEIINMFRSDNGELYIYVPPYGGYNVQEHPDVDCILLTGSWNQNATEVLYVVRGLTRLHAGGKKATEQDREKQRALIKKENIRYGGTYLHDIKMAAEEETISFYLTFHAEVMQKPRKKLFLSWNGDSEIHTEHKDVFSLPSDYKYQRQYGYVSAADAQIVNDIIQNVNLWEDVQIQPIGKSSAQQTESMNMVKLIHKTYDETIYTNLFYEFFNAYPHVFTKFVREVLGVPTNESFSVSKEVSTADKKGRLDLLAVSENYVIAIENKLQSGLNGIDKHCHLSQLTTYCKDLEGKFDKEKCHFFLFEPDYNDIDIAQFDPQAANQWKKRRYSVIYKFMNENRELLLQGVLGKYADDFIEALFMHTKDLRQIVEQRFLEAVQ